MKDAEHEHTQIEPEHWQRRNFSKMALRVGAVILVALLIIGGFLAARTLGFGAFAPSHVSTATPIPGSNLFYIQGSPPWGSASVDGHLLKQVPNAGTDKPLQLSEGTHVIEWNAPPFLSQRCTVVVPTQAVANVCTGSGADTVQPGPGAWTITFSESLATLPGAQRTALVRATQSMLDSSGSVETVQPGEHFVDVLAPQMIATATQSLKATVRFQVDTNPGSTQPCTAINLKRCEANLDCHLFCNPLYDVPLSQADIKGWDVYGVVKTTWSYTTLSGQVLAQNQPDAPGSSGTEYLQLLFIRWDGSAWHVSTKPGEDGQSPLIAPLSPVDPPCLLAQFRTLGDPSFSTLALGGQVQMVNWHFVTGVNPAQGCLALATVPTENRATPTPPPSTAAWCLYRFGVLLAANALAHRYWPQLPLTDAYEQNLAQHLVARISSALQ